MRRAVETDACWSAPRLMPRVRTAERKDFGEQGACAVLCTPPLQASTPTRRGFADICKRPLARVHYVSKW